MEKAEDRGAQHAAIHDVAKSLTQFSKQTTTYSGKESEKKMYHFAVQMKHCESNILQFKKK